MAAFSTLALLGLGLLGGMGASKALQKKQDFPSTANQPIVSAPAPSPTPPSTAATASAAVPVAAAAGVRQRRRAQGASLTLRRTPARFNPAATTTPLSLLGNVS